MTFTLDYDQEGNIIKWHPDKQGKRKKKFEGSTNIDSITNPTNPTRDVHKFIFDDEAVVVDDCSFVLPYIESGYYYPPITPPLQVNDLPLTSSDEYATPIVPVYTEQHLKELLRRQV